jgi:hypothetical protein
MSTVVPSSTKAISPRVTLIATALPLHPGGRILVTVVPGLADHPDGALDQLPAPLIIEGSPNKPR